MPSGSLDVESVVEREYCGANVERRLVSVSSE